MEKILVVDDSILQGTALKNILAEEYEVEMCCSGEEALERTAAFRPDLILLDIIMQGMNGFETLVRLKGQAATQNIPVILITSLDDAGNEEKGLRIGAVDYITKPFNAGIVRARVRTHMQLYSFRRAFETLAMIDGLTGIPNRRYYDDQCSLEWFKAMRDQRPLSIGLLDVDYFKQYNDMYGHPSGDQVLIRLARYLNGHMRQSGDVAARYGGEEFVFLLPDTPREEGIRIAREICQGIAAMRIPHKDSREGVLTVSIGGVTVVPGIEYQYSEYFQFVDEMLYRAKDNGRNNVAWL